MYTCVRDARPAVFCILVMVSVVCSSPCVWTVCDCVLELVVCRVRFARVSCPWLRFVDPAVSQVRRRIGTG